MLLIKVFCVCSYISMLSNEVQEKARPVSTTTTMEIFFCMVFLCSHIVVYGQEPHCNKFSFEEQLLEKMVRLEFKVENMFNSITKSQSDIVDLALKVNKELDIILKEKENMMSELNKHKTNINKQFVDVGKETAHQLNDFENKIFRFSGDLRELRNQTSVFLEGLSATYIRWGRTTCPKESSIVYEGYASGSHNTHSGGPSNTICLPKDPQFDRSFPGQQSCYVYGAEYQENSRLSSIFGKSIEDENVPCAVCQISGRSTILMVPARMECYEGWHLEYSGYLMTDHHTHYRADMKCVDGNPEIIAGQGGNANGDLFYFVEAAGEIPSNPYTRGKELTCVVCSK